MNEKLSFLYFGGYDNTDLPFNSQIWLLGYLLAPREGS
jgi:hypothetical protein